MANIAQYRQQLDTLTDEILKKSGSTMKKIEQHIKMNHSLRLSNSLISQMDLQVTSAGTSLQQYQFFLSELNSLLIRGEYLDAQLNILEAHQDLNAKRATRGLSQLDDWKDNDLNIRTIEATLDNLYLEFRYLTRKLESSFKISTRSQPFTQSYNHPEEVDQKPIKIPKTRSSDLDLDLNLKPIRCVSRIEETPSSPKLSNPFNLLTKRKTHTSLPTPDSSFNTTQFSHSSPVVREVEKTPSKDITLSKAMIPSPLSFKSNKKHIRCASLPQSIDLSAGGDQTSSILDDISELSPLKDTKFNLRHFLSHDTGLKIKTRGDGKKDFEEEDEEEGVKDSQFVNSPVSLKLESFLINPNPPKKEKVILFKDKEEEDDDDEENKGDEEKKRVEVIKTEEEESRENEEGYFLPTFEHKLNRSNSCDSIFSTMKSRVPLCPVQDNRQQTLNWMKSFNNPNRANITKETTITTSFVNPSITTSIDSRQALSHLVSQRTAQPTVTTTTTTSSMMSSFQSFFKRTPVEQSTVAQQKSTTKTPDNKPAEEVPKASEYHSFSQHTAPTPAPNQWASLLTRLGSQSLIPSQSIVTSEVGKPISPIPITRDHTKRSHQFHERVKGSASTLTIGPNGSKHVQHGESSSLAQSMVLSSRVSHAALKDALDNDFLRVGF